MKILLLDDHTLFRESLRRLLEGSPEFQVVGQFGRAAEAFAAVRKGLALDLALVDYELDDTDASSTNGLAAATQLRQLRPGLPILMVTAGMPGKDLLRAVQETRVGVFLKSEPADELLLAMRRTAGGELWLSSSAALALVEQTATRASTPDAAFSDRERHVLNLLLNGLTNKEIGVQIQASESTVKAIMQRLFGKAGVRSRSQLVRFAVELGSPRTP